jgi:hypothetical protein
MNFPFGSLGKLRVLKLGENFIEDLPGSIGLLSNLQLFELEKNP